MKIPIHYSLKVARQVVNKIQLPKEIAKDCSVESWSNCREQGLHITRYGFASNTIGRGVNIAQQRNSDSILVCWGDATEFDDHNQESDMVYEIQKRYFRYDEQEKASRFIARYLETGKTD